MANLLELYAHDFSEFHNVEIGEDGKFGYQALPLYWSEPDRHPFLIMLAIPMGFIGVLVIFYLMVAKPAMWG